jgi:hypothetical protein
VKQPQRFTVKHVALDGLPHTFFVELENALEGVRTSEPRGHNDPQVRNATLLSVVRPLVTFAVSLPAITRQAADLSNQSRAVRDALLGGSEPDVLLLETLPKAVGMPPLMESGEVRSQEARQFKTRLVSALKSLQGHYHLTLEHCRSLLHAAFGVSSGVSQLREDLRIRASYLVGKVIDARLRAFVLAAVDEKTSDRGWLEALAMVVADRPAMNWTHEDHLAFELNVAETARRFANLEALQKEAAAHGVEGYDARRITITLPDGREINRMVWFNRQSGDRILEHATRLVNEIRSIVDEHQQQAVLVAMTEQLLEDSARDSVSDHQRNALSGPKKGDFRQA